MAEGRGEIDSKVSENGLVQSQGVRHLYIIVYFFLLSESTHSESFFLAIQRKKFIKSRWKKSMKKWTLFY